jgi:2-phosphosulfolactate phosphatase
MRVRVFFSLAEVDPAELADRTVVVIDVLRATSTIVTAVANGAKAVYPVGSPEEAMRLFSSIGREGTLLCGERRGHKVEGYHLGNSPSEFTHERVAGQRLVMSTTNGTRALQAASAGSERVLVGSLLNLGAVARLATFADGLVVLCAGREQQFALDDALCAGLLLDRVADGRRDELDLDDAGRVARALSAQMAPTPELLRTVAGGRALVDIGLGGDVADCARVDVYDVVPEMHDRMIRLEHVS